MTGTPYAMGTSIEDFGGVGDGTSDSSTAFQTATAALQASGGGTLSVPDGVYGLRTTLQVPPGVSLQLAPGATIMALPDFEDETIVQIGQRIEDWPRDQYFIGGKIDGNKQPLIGLRIPCGLGVTVENLVVNNALKTGIEMGAERCHEICLSKVRVLVDRDTKALPDSKGLHFIHAHDSVARDVVVTGYAFCVWNSASSNNFHMVHVWNYDTNVTLQTCFHDEGNNNSYLQCYGDGPTVAPGEIGYGWYLEGPYTRIVSSQLYASHWTEPNTMVGIYVAPEARAPTFIANHFLVCSPHNPHGGSRRHDMKAAFAGKLEDAAFFGNTYAKWIGEGKIFGIASLNNEGRSGGTPED